MVAVASCQAAFSSSVCAACRRCRTLLGVETCNRRRISNLVGRGCNSTCPGWTAVTLIGSGTVLREGWSLKGRRCCLCHVSAMLLFRRLFNEGVPEVVCPATMAAGGLNQQVFKKNTLLEAVGHRLLLAEQDSHGHPGLPAVLLAWIPASGRFLAMMQQLPNGAFTVFNMFSTGCRFPDEGFRLPAAARCLWPCLLTLLQTHSITQQSYRMRTNLFCSCKSAACMTNSDPIIQAPMSPKSQKSAGLTTSTLLGFQ